MRQAVLDRKPITVACYVCEMPAVEAHWRIWSDDSADVWPVCQEHVAHSRRCDIERCDFRFLYLPIVQPVMGSEAAIAMEAAMYAAARLLRICNDGAESAESLALLRAAQVAAWERVHGKEAV